MASQPDPTQAGSKFSILLTPSRELEASWEIDIAKELSRYAASLGIEIINDDTDSDPSATSTAVDFAEAALLVQGSTSIYSRKVEHLYNLVYSAVSTLNQLGGKEKKAGNGSTTPQSTDADADALFNIDEINFLTLDDVMKIGDPKAITLTPADLPTAGSLDDQTCLRPVPPMLIQGRSADDRKLGTANYKVLTAQTHSSGAMIMEGCPPVDENLDTLPQRPNFEEVFKDTNEENTAPTQVFDDDDDDHGEPIDISQPTGDDLEIDEEGHPAMPSQTADNSEKPVEEQKDVKADVSKSKRDPFMLLDPHEEIKSQVKPIRVGKTFRRPRKSRVMNLWGWTEEGLDENLADDSMRYKIPSGASIKTYVVTEAAKKHVRYILRKRLMKKLQLPQEEYDSDLEVEEMRSACDGDIGNMENDVGIEDALLDSTVDFDNDFDVPDELPVPPTLVGEENSANVFDDTEDFSQDGLGIANDHILQLASSYEETCRQYLEKTAWMWEQKVTDTKLVKRVEKWSARIQPILDEEEQRKEFDIREYGQTIVDRFRDYKKKTGEDEARMSSLLKSDSRHEACRMFLASLQLANNYSIEIMQEEECVVANPMLKLLEQSGDKVFTTPKARSKRARNPSGTPLSAARKPLRPRMDNNV